MQVQIETFYQFEFDPLSGNTKHSKISISHSRIVRSRRLGILEICRYSLSTGHLPRVRWLPPGWLLDVCPWGDVYASTLHLTSIIWWLPRARSTAFELWVEADSCTMMRCEGLFVNFKLKVSYDFVANYKRVTFWGDAGMLDRMVRIPCYSTSWLLFRFLSKSQTSLTIRATGVLFRPWNPSPTNCDVSTTRNPNFS